MYLLKCPSCNKQVRSFWHLGNVFFIYSKKKKCNNCQEDIKTDYAVYYSGAIIFLVVLLVIKAGFLLTSHIDPLFVGKVKDWSASLLMSGFYSILFLLMKIILLLLILYYSYELPAKYFDKRLFRKN